MNQQQIDAERLSQVMAIRQGAGHSHDRGVRMNALHAYRDDPQTCADPLLALAAVRAKALTFERARTADEQFSTRFDSDTYLRAKRAAMRPVASRLRQADMLAGCQMIVNDCDRMRELMGLERAA